MGGGQRVLVLREDIRRIAAHHSLAEHEFVGEYCEVSHDLARRAGGQILQIKPQGSKCPFLTGDNLCGIHDVKPFQCRHGPENLLPNVMASDYECMRDVIGDSDEDKTEQFFNKLVEEAQDAKWTCDQHGYSDR